ncbi:MAG: type VI secretion system baseplate subunit TssK [Opitutaceae bacterium]|jgi:type VI secretion system ImpJ/VasE family protein|nr:type VI secretion system baseplate subunit TssK [Opitutaceae bacterium]
MSLNIHWHEGLFLQPHHLQRLQLGAIHQGQSDRRIGRPYPYGIIEARLSLDELANFRVRFDKLRVLMPGGLDLCFPENAELPSIDIKPLFAGSGSVFTIYLGVPVWREGRANAGGESPDTQPDAAAKIIHRVREETLADENTGDNAKPILTRRYNARFVLDDDDKSDLELVPVLRLVRGVGEQLGQPKPDPEFVPPCLFVTGSGALHNLVRDLVNQLEASRQELVIQLNRAGVTMDTLRGAQIEQILRFRSLNHFSARLSSLLAAANITPFAWYLELRALHAELAALHPGKDDYESAPAYNHENLFNAFNPLSAKIRGLLRGVVTATFLKLEFKPGAAGLEAVFTEEHLTRPVDYFLGVKSRDDPRAVVTLVEDGNRFKLMPKSLATRAVRGVAMKEERFPPMQLPAVAGMTFFRLNRAESARVWQLLLTEKAAVIRWPDQEKSDYEITLYMTLGG